MPESAADAAARASAAVTVAAEQLHLTEAEVQSALQALRDGAEAAMPRQSVDAARQLASSFDSFVAAAGVSLPLSPTAVLAGLVALALLHALLPNLDRRLRRQRAASFARRVLGKDEEKLFRC